MQIAAAMGTNPANARARRRGRESSLAGNDTSMKVVAGLKAANCAASGTGSTHRSKEGEEGMQYGGIERTDEGKPYPLCVPNLLKRALNLTKLTLTRSNLGKCITHAFSYP
jgi:hypothetical protein